MRPMRSLSHTPRYIGFMLACALAVLASLAACYWPYYYDDPDNFDDDDDCIEVCDRIDDCTNDGDFDTSDCIDDCSARSFDSSAYEDDVDDCAACIDETCAEARDCERECEGIVDVDIIDVDVVVVE